MSATTNGAPTQDGAYDEDVLRVVRGTPNHEELAALVAALLLLRRSRGGQQDAGHFASQPHDEQPTGRDAAHASTAPPPQDRPAWLRGHYSPPGSWTAGA